MFVQCSWNWRDESGFKSWAETAEIAPNYLQPISRKLTPDGQLKLWGGGVLLHLYESTQELLAKRMCATMFYNVIWYDPKIFSIKFSVRGYYIKIFAKSLCCHAIMDIYTKKTPKQLSLVYIWSSRKDVFWWINSFQQTLVFKSPLQENLQKTAPLYCQFSWNEQRMKRTLGIKPSNF